jgi:hypothetical protein
VDQFSLLCGERGASSLGPYLNPGDVLFLDCLEILLHRSAYSPLKIVINKYQHSAIVVHWLVHQIRIKESKQD